MPCPTCDGTMQAIGCKVTDLPFFWCPRCGTIKPCHEAEATAPDLVRRCRELEKLRPVKFGFAWPGNEWEQLGIAEAINRPEDRPNKE